MQLPKNFVRDFNVVKALNHYSYDDLTKITGRSANIIYKLSREVCTTLEKPTYNSITEYINVFRGDYGKDYPLVKLASWPKKTRKTTSDTTKPFTPLGNSIVIPKGSIITLKYDESGNILLSCTKI